MPYEKKLVLIMALLLTLSAGSGCASLNSGSASGSSQEDQEAEKNSENTADTEETSQSVSVEEQTDEDMFTDRDYEEDYQEEDCVAVTLSGTSASSSSDSVEISDNTITITEEGAYLISGTLRDGMIIVDAPDTAKVRLIFEGVEINSETSAPLYILEADKEFRSGGRFFIRCFPVNRGREQHQHERDQSSRRSADLGWKLYY